MASAGELVDTSQNGNNDNNATNGDSDRLEYSGLSEDNLNVSDPKGAIAKGIVEDFGEEFDEHGAPAPSVKAVKRDIIETNAFSDDEHPKTLTTLETVKKPSAAVSAVSASTENDEIEICPIEADDDEFEEEPILLEVYHEDDEHKETESGDLQQQQQQQPQHQQKAVTYESRRERKQQFNVLTNDVGGRRAAPKVQTPKLGGKKAIQNDEAIITPNRPIPAQSQGTIEIPRELITSDVSVISPIIINHVKNPSANSDELIAILEGDDNGCVNANASVVEHYELSLASAPSAGGGGAAAAAANTNGGTEAEQPMALTAEEEREIAMEQIMSLPKKKKGRPKLNQALKVTRETKFSKKKKNTLVNSLVSEWDEGEAKQDEAIETEIVVEIRPQKKQAIVEPVQQATFRRSRIIKKKIIWDPDAPETYLNYASLAHTSGAGPIKRPRKSTTKSPKAEPSIDDGAVEVTETELQMADDTDTVVSTIPAPKKKKTSEIDKLLGDEGAANMLNSLQQGNNNNNKIDGASPAKIPRSKSAKNDACNVQNASNTTAKVKSTKSSASSASSSSSSKEVKEPSPQKQHQLNQANANNKKNVTPKSIAAGKKRGPKTSDTWDYIYKSRPDDCMIIRRRSNSSYSSTQSLNRMSIDLPNAPYCDFDGGENDHQEIEMPNKRQRSAKAKNFEFAKPKARKIGKSDTNDTKYANSFDETKNSADEVNNVFANYKAHRSDDIDFSALPIKLENGNDNNIVYTQISVCRFQKFTQIILHTDAAETKCLLNVQVRKIKKDSPFEYLLKIVNVFCFCFIYARKQAMKEIESALHSIENDKNCKLVLLTSAGKSFCDGCDYSMLVQSTSEKRRVSAIDLSKKFR